MKGKIEMEQDTFTTSTDTQYWKDQSIKSMSILFLVLSCFASLGLLIALQTFLIFEMLVSFICFFSYYITQKNIHDCRLCFENDFLLIKDRTTGEVFEVYDIPASDFIITQSAKEKKLNICGMAIKETVFILPCLKHCNELKKYISENFQ